jgi:hypothetical protein
MTREEESKRKLVESLCLEINHAIISSQDVKSCLQSVRDLDYLDTVEGCNLALEIQVVLGLTQNADR